MDKKKKRFRLVSHLTGSKFVNVFNVHTQSPRATRCLPHSSLQALDLKSFAHRICRHGQEQRVYASGRHAAERTRRLRHGHQAGLQKDQDRPPGAGAVQTGGRVALPGTDGVQAARGGSGHPPAGRAWCAPQAAERTEGPLLKLGGNELLQVAARGC